MGVCSCSILSKKSIRSGAIFGGSGFGGAEAVVGLLASDDAGFNPLLPLLLASLAARYWRRLTSKSGSFKYSSRELVREVGACLMLGIWRRVLTSTRRAL